MSFPIESEVVYSILPQKYPFQFVDRILSFEKDKCIITSKFFAADEFYFQGHFPSRPVVPGVLLVENMAQSAGLLFAFTDNNTLRTDDFSSKSVSLGVIKKVHFKIAIFPGDRIETQIDIVKIISTGAIVSAVIKKDNTICAEGSLSLSLFEPK